MIKNIHLMKSCIGYEVLFAKFLKNEFKNEIISLSKIGINGHISVSNDFIDN